MVPRFIMRPQPDCLSEGSKPCTRRAMLSTFFWYMSSQASVSAVSQGGERRGTVVVDEDVDIQRLFIDRGEDGVTSALRRDIALHRDCIGQGGGHFCRATIVFIGVHDNACPAGAELASNDFAGVSIGAGNQRCSA